MRSTSWPERRRSGMRPDGRLACGCRRKSTRLLKLYFFSNAPSGTEALASNLRSFVIARRVTGGAPARMKQPFPMLRGHRIRRLQGEVVPLQRQQKVRELSRGLFLFVRAQRRQHIRHRGAGLGPVRIADERFEVIRIHPGTDLGESRRLFRARWQGCVVRRGKPHNSTLQSEPGPSVPYRAGW